MKRKLFLLLAPVLGATALLLGPALAPAKASTPPVAVNTSAARPFMCLGGLPIRGTGAICLNTYQL
jgi:hypothetical protein